MFFTAIDNSLNVRSTRTAGKPRVYVFLILVYIKLFIFSLALSKR